MAIHAIRGATGSHGDWHSGLTDKALVRVTGVVTLVREITTKSGNRMAFATVEDTAMKIEIVVFSELYGEKGHLLAGGSRIVVVGTLERDGTTTKVLADEIGALQ